MVEVKSQTTSIKEVAVQKLMTDSLSAEQSTPVTFSRSWTESIYLEIKGS